MILRASFLFLVMISALAGVFSRNDGVDVINTTPPAEKTLPLLKGWSPASQILAKQIMEKYGMPGEYTESMLVWKNNGKWKKTILFKEPVQHNFPVAHTDVLEQTINCRVPEEKFDELAKFNGSITANRTNGTITVRCRDENFNITALNLAYEIINGKKTFNEARLEFYKSAGEIMRGRIPENARYLNFDSDAGAADPR